MQRVSLNPDLNLSRLVYGMWRLADDQDRSAGRTEAKIQACLEQGITTFDQADIYGGYQAETILGEALKANPSLRPKMEIITKCDIVVPGGPFSRKGVKHYNTSREYIEAAVQRSLSKMSTDYLDLLLLHRPDPLMDHHETGAALDDLVKSGTVRAIGVSNFRPWDCELLQSAMSNRLVTNQIEISLVQLAPFTNGDIAFHQKNSQALMAWSPLGGGRILSDSGELGQTLDRIAGENGVDRAAVATAFLLHHPANIMPIMGTNTLERIASISDALRVRMDREDWFLLYTAALGHRVP
ncbi:aldo/keto reductase [Kiloniella sp. b19]|uniref:aldo/keto reductase n=1 Tax=Kiloniella sp. GXU_MW_B19 TaxID=3141326 RepID=UPI0031E35643